MRAEQQGLRTGMACFVTPNQVANFVLLDGHVSSLHPCCYCLICLPHRIAGERTGKAILLFTKTSQNIAPFHYGASRCFNSHDLSSLPTDDSGRTATA